MLATALVRRAGRCLLVASRYPNQTAPLWHLPGGRRRAHETFAAAARRELAEEAGLNGRVGKLAYASESFDLTAAIHVLNLTFETEADDGTAAVQADAHVVDLAWVPLDELAERMSVTVVREPLLAYLRGDGRRYYEFADAEISIEFADEP